jgi:hypothetical protein
MKQATGSGGLLSCFRSLGSPLEIVLALVVEQNHEAPDVERVARMATGVVLPVLAGIGESTG